MSCAYRHAAVRIATIAGIPTDLMMTAMDIARQRRVTFPALPPDRLRTIAPLLGITPTCGNPQQVIARIQAALLALGTIHSTHLWVGRWMAVAAALGVPDDHLPVPVHPEIMTTVRAQWAAPPPNPAPDRATAGIAALWQGDPIPDELIEEALRMGDRTAIVTWIAHGVWDDRFGDICADLTDTEIGRIVRAGVLPDGLVPQIAKRSWSDDLPWDAFPLDLWDRVPNPDVARKGRARTAAAQFIRYPDLRADDRLIAAFARDPVRMAEVLRHDHLRDDRLIAAAAEDAAVALEVVCRTNLRDDRLIAAVAEDAAMASEVVCRTNLRDARLIAAAATDAAAAAEVLCATDIRDERLIDVIVQQQDADAAARVLCDTVIRDERLIDVIVQQQDADAAAWVLCDTVIRDERLIDVIVQQQDAWAAAKVLRHNTNLDCEQLIVTAAKDAWAASEVLSDTDIRDERLIVAAAKQASAAAKVLTRCEDLHTDDRLITAVAQEEFWAAWVLRFTTICDDRLITTIAHNPSQVRNIRQYRPDLSTHPLFGAEAGQHGD